MRRAIVVVSVLSLLIGAAYGTDLFIDNGRDVRMGFARNRTTGAGIRGHCRANQAQTCDSNTGGGGALPCTIASDICDFAISQFEDTSANGRMWIDPNGAVWSCTPGGQCAALLGGASLSIFSFTNTGKFGIQGATHTGMLGCTGYGFRIDGSNNTMFGNFDGCSEPAFPSRVAILASAGFPTLTMQLVAGSTRPTRNLWQIKQPTVGNGSAPLATLSVSQGVTTFRVHVDVVCSGGCITAGNGTGGAGETITRIRNIGGFLTKIGTDLDGTFSCPCVATPCTCSGITGGIPFVEDTDGTLSFNITTSGTNMIVNGIVSGGGAAEVLQWNLTIEETWGGI